jgi:hypothetical protein
MIPELPETILKFNLSSDEAPNVQGQIFGGIKVDYPESTRDYVLRIGEDGYAFSREELTVLRNFITEMLDT